MMKPYGARYTITPIADGFADDCDELIHRCLQSETLNYHVFCNIWKDMNFALVFHGRSSGAELAELSEELVYIAKRYIVANTSNYEESVAGLFLVYALVHLQPYAGFAPLRLTPEDLDAVQCIKDIARKQKRYDVLYILGSLLIEGPVQFHLAEREHGLEMQLKKGFDGIASQDKLGVRPKGVFFRPNEELDLLRELASLGRRYTRAKALLTGGSKPDCTLSYVNEHLASQLSASLKQLINGNVDTATPTVSHHDKVQSIKHRAMTETVNQMKHLMSVQTRKSSAEAEGPSTSKSDIRSRPGKVKTGSPSKPVPTSSPKKRPEPSRLYGPKKKRPKYDSSDSDDASTFVPSGDSDDDVSSEKDSDTEDLGTLDEVLDKIRKQKEASQDMVEVEIDPTQEVEHRIEIEVEDDSRPSVVCENSQSSAELIIPDLIMPDRDDSEVNSKETAKNKRGGLRPVNNKKLKQATKIRLNSLGILSVIEKTNKDKL